MKGVSKTDPNLVLLIDELKRESREGGAAIWRDIARRLERPRRNWAEVNISRLELYANDGDTIVVPGKVLGAGSLSKKLTVAAFRLSDSARNMIENAGGRNITIEELVEENPSGSGVRIMR
jgi:large subunit ribosomal protein L18e